MTTCYIHRLPVMALVLFSILLACNTEKRMLDKSTEKQVNSDMQYAMGKSQALIRSMYGFPESELINKGDTILIYREYCNSDHGVIYYIKRVFTIRNGVQKARYYTGEKSETDNI